MHRKSFDFSSSVLCFRDLCVTDLFRHIRVRILEAEFAPAEPTKIIEPAEQGHEGLNGETYGAGETPCVGRYRDSTETVSACSFDQRDAGVGAHRAKCDDQDLPDGVHHELHWAGGTSPR